MEATGRRQRDHHGETVSSAISVRNLRQDIRNARHVIRSLRQFIRSLRQRT
jgi:hypothetical protein